MLASIKEEMHRLKTDPLVWLVCLMIPICINFIIGWQLQQGVMSHLPMGIVDNDHSQLSRQIVAYFKDNDTFDIKYEAIDQETLETLLDTSKIRIGMVIPKNFEADVVSVKAPNVLMLYDGSHMSITSMTKSKASEILLTARTGASIKQIQSRLGKNYKEAYTAAMPINFESRTLYNPTKNFNYFMTPGYGTIVCQLGIALMGVVCVNSPRNRKINAWGYASAKIIFYGILGSLAAIINILVQVYYFKIPCRGSIIVACGLSVLFTFAVAALTIAVSAWFHNRVLAMAIIGLLLIPNSIMAGYTWPVLSMIPIYRWGAKMIPFSHYGDNIRDLFLKGYTLNLKADIMFFIGFSIVMLIISTLGIQIAQFRKPREVDLR